MARKKLNSELSVLVVDDSTVFRRIIRGVCSNIPGANVVGHASNGDNALKQIELLNPDIVLLDIQMPGKDGLDVLHNLREADRPPSVIVLTSESDTSIKDTTRALELGAFDFVFKPSKASAEENHQLLVSELGARMLAIAGKGSPDTHPNPSHTSSGSGNASFAPRRSKDGQMSANVVAIGLSTGGPSALTEVLPALPADFPLPILIAQHMPAGFTKNLAHDLDSVSALKVKEAKDGDLVLPGNVYIAPGGRQMMVRASTLHEVIRITDSGASNHCSPSVDYLLRSVASVYGSGALVAIMTGMGDDGVKGCKAVADSGGVIITQNESSCVIYGMPRRVVEAGLSSKRCHLSGIANEMINAANHKESRCPR